MQVKREAKIYIRKLPSGNTSYRVDLGKIHGKRVTKDFQNQVEAQKFASKANAELHKRNTGALQDLAHAQRYEILSALEKLKPLSSTITEAVDFYIRYAKPPKKLLTVKEGMAIFRREKLNSKRTQRYLDAMESNYLKPLAKAFPKQLLNEITKEEIKRFIYKPNRNPKTISNYIRSLSAFFNYFIKEGHMTLNPISKIERPILVESSPSCLIVADVHKMLQYALDKGRKPECACMALILFCGVRFEEVGKLSWEDINFDSGKVTLRAKITKKGRKRINAISENAKAWLELCKSTGNVAPQNYVNRMRAIRTEAKILYPQNAMRHSFASYHVAMHENASLTAFMLGHPDSVLLYNTYRELVPQADAKRYWKIRPDGISPSKKLPYFTTLVAKPDGSIEKEED